MKSYKIFKTDVFYSNDRCVPLFHLLEDCITYAFESTFRGLYKEFYCNSYIHVCNVMFINRYISIESYTFFVDYLLRCTKLDAYISYHAIDIPRVCFCSGVVVTDLSTPSSPLYHIADDLLYSADDILLDTNVTLHDWLDTLPSELVFPFH